MIVVRRPSVSRSRSKAACGSAEGATCAAANRTSSDRNKEPARAHSMPPAVKLLSTSYPASAYYSNKYLGG
jgi:hypothetical protein